MAIPTQHTPVNVYDRSSLDKLFLEFIKIQYKLVNFKNKKENKCKGKQSMGKIKLKVYNKLEKYQIDACSKQKCRVCTMR